MHFSGLHVKNLPFSTSKNLRLQITENYRYNWLYGILQPIYFDAFAEGQENPENIFFKIVIKLIFFASVSRKILFLPFTK